MMSLKTPSSRVFPLRSFNFSRMIFTESKSPEFMAREDKYGAHNYKPIPVVLERGKGIYVWDVDNKKYYDQLSAFSALSFGHCPKPLIDVLISQSKRLHLTSRAFYTDQLGYFEEEATKKFGLDMCLMMNSGVEAVESSVKIARRWGYEVKGVPNNSAVVVCPSGNFWGRSIAAISASDDPYSFKGYGPFLPGFDRVPYNDLLALEAKFESDPNVVAYLFEPIQGEAGINVPSPGYIKEVRRLCDQYNVLMIADEVQTGLSRTGNLIACHYEGVTPDLLVLGKALSGGLMPISCVLGKSEAMSVLTPGTHGSTFGGNPLSAAIARRALSLLDEWNLSENAREMGSIQRERLDAIVKKYPDIFVETRGRGLLNALVVRPDAMGAKKNKVNAYNFCMAAVRAPKVWGGRKGVLIKPTHEDIIRFAAPLIISKEEVHASMNIVEGVVDSVVRGKGKAFWTN